MYDHRIVIRVTLDHPMTVLQTNQILTALEPVFRGKVEVIQAKVFQDGLLEYPKDIPMPNGKKLRTP